MLNFFEKINLKKLLKYLLFMFNRHNSIFVIFCSRVIFKLLNELIIFP